MGKIKPYRVISTILAGFIILSGMALNKYTLKQYQKTISQRQPVQVAVAFVSTLKDYYPEGAAVYCKDISAAQLGQFRKDITLSYLNPGDKELREYISPNYIPEIGEKEQEMFAVVSFLHTSEPNSSLRVVLQYDSERQAPHKWYISQLTYYDRGKKARSLGT